MRKKNMPAKKQEQGKVGAALVIGGGIAGIQASLDLAESGQKVYLLERSPAIGGHMAQLDKTFPTNDCSMCILSPKLVECGRHLNVDLISLGELKSLEGEAGNFQARIARKARYVDPAKCTGCGDCLAQCPTRLKPDYGAQPYKVNLKPEEKSLVDELIETHGASQRSLMRVMQEVNSRLRYLPKDVIHYLAARYSIPASIVHRIATFYTAFSLTPRGKHTISVCTGTACHIKGASRIVDEFKRELGADIGGTSGDMLFTLEAVRCLGCCSLAPALKIDDRVYGNVKTSQVSKIIGDYRK